MSALNAAEIRDLADKLVAAGSSLRPAVAELMSTWSQSDPDAAVLWLLDGAAVVDRSHLRSLAEGFARGDVEISAQTVDVLPSELRGNWITAVAGVYVQRSPDAGLEWLAQYRDEPDYDTWINAAAERSIATPFGQDFGRTAAMLATAREPDERVAHGVAVRWAESDPRAAADWAFGLGEAQARSGAVAGTVRSWMRQDRPQAERWVLTPKKL